MTCIPETMEFCWFAICTKLALIPWILAEEKLLYQTPNENRWGGWEATTNGPAQVNVIIKLVNLDEKCISIPSVKEQLSYGGPGFIIVDPPSLLKESSVRRAPLSK